MNLRRRQGLTLVASVLLAVLTVFVAHLYGKTFTPLEVLMVAAASAATLLGLASITAWLAGVGVGLRSGQDPQIRPSGSTPWTLTP